MNIVERVARALASSDNRWKLIRWQDISDTVKTMFRADAKAAIRAMLEGQEPVAWRYFIKSPEAGMGKTLLRTSRDPHLVDDGWTETPLYDLSALKEAVK